MGRAVTSTRNDKLVQMKITPLQAIGRSNRPSFSPEMPPRTVMTNAQTGNVASKRQGVLVAWTHPAWSEKEHLNVPDHQSAPIQTIAISKQWLGIQHCLLLLSAWNIQRYCTFVPLLLLQLLLFWLIAARHDLSLTIVSTLSLLIFACLCFCASRHDCSQSRKVQRWWAEMFWLCFR